MILVRFFLIVFNIAVIGFLIYRMIRITHEPVEPSRKRTVIIGGLILLVLPVGIFFRVFGPTPVYFLVYPLAIALFLYLTKQLR